MRGDTIQSSLFNMYELLFVAEEGDLYLHTLEHHLDYTNSFILDIYDGESDEDMIIQHVYVCDYIKKNIKDSDLDIDSDICMFLKSIHDKTNIGIHIYDKYK